MEALVRIVDRSNADPVKDAKVLKRGDVIAVQDDGFAWGVQELLNPDWRIFSCAITKTSAEAQAMVAREAGLFSNRMLRKRGVMIDISLLPVAIQTACNPALPRPSGVLVVTLAQLNAARVVKAPLVDPGVIG